MRFSSGSTSQGFRWEAIPTLPTYHRHKTDAVYKKAKAFAKAHPGKFSVKELADKFGCSASVLYAHSVGMYCKKLKRGPKMVETKKAQAAQRRSYVAEWIAANPDATLSDCRGALNVTDEIIRQSEKIAGIKLRRKSTNKQ